MKFILSYDKTMIVCWSRNGKEFLSSDTDFLPKIKVNEIADADEKTLDFVL